MATNPSRDILGQIIALAGQPRISYPEGDVNFPTTERIQTLQRGKAPKAFLSAEPDTTRFADLKLVEQSVIGSDQTSVQLYQKFTKIPGPVIGPTASRLDEDGLPIYASRQKVLAGSVTAGSTVVTGIWYRVTEEPINTFLSYQVTEARAVPGNPVTRKKWDEDSETFITETRTLKMVSAITPATSYIIGTSATKVEREDIDGGVVAHEVVTVYVQSVHNDQGSARPSDKGEPYQFPARVDFSIFATFGNVAIGYREPKADDVILTTADYWVIGASKPALPIDAIDYPLDTMYLPNGFALKDCIRDAGTIIYSPGGTVNYTGSTPNFTTFSGTWINTARVIRGSVATAGTPNRWKVSVVYVMMR